MNNCNDLHVFVWTLFLLLSGSFAIEVDIHLTKVYGPGLYPDKIVLPVRYFFIETYDTNGKRINQSDGSSFKVQVEGEYSPGTYCRVWVQVLDRYDGSYIARYRTYQTCKKTSISVLYKHKHVAGSPYIIADPVYAEYCYCPLNTMAEWQTALECPQYPLIDEMMASFHDVNMDLVLQEVEQRFHKAGSRSFCNYVVKNNKVYRRCYGQYVGFSMFMDNILHSLVRKVRLPDLDFIINLGDWPLISKEVKPVIPIFSWCGSDDTEDIVLPTYELTDATLEMMGRVMLDILSVQSNNKIPWAEKKPMGFWRGRDSRRERLDLVKLSRERKDLINASLTNFFFFKDEENVYGPKEKHESFFNFFDYKYQINVDGTVAAYRLPYLLGGGGVVFKQDSPYYEHFYKDLIPNVHYIPFKRDLSDLVEKIEWALAHDDEVHQIGMNGRQYVHENLLPEDVFCFHGAAFSEWSRRVSSPVRVREGMEHVPVPQNEKRFGQCGCHRLKHDEL